LQRNDKRLESFNFQSKSGRRPMIAEGLATLVSACSFEETLARIEAALGDRNITLFARIDHAAGALAAGLDLRPTTVLIFGNPRAGTPLMRQRREIGLELPLKMLVWEDDAGIVRLSYDEPVWMAARFGIDPDLVEVKALSAALAALAALVGEPNPGLT
jgi:uncharacterized protein (DUF302 family)